MKKIISILVVLLFMLLLTACGGAVTDIPPSASPAETTSPADTPTDTPAQTPSETPADTPVPTASPAEVRARPDADREGFAITLPDEINTIVSIGPSNTEVIAALGLGGKVIAADRFSEGIAGIDDAVAVLDLMLIDAEYLIELNPDIIFVTGLTRAHDDDAPLRLISDVGISVVHVPTSVSIDAIMKDIQFIAEVLDMHDAGEYILANMQAELDAIREIAAGITQVRTVYFEISPAPTMWSLGSNTFINEMIELIGAVNIFRDDEGWLSVADETLLDANPDVIITSVNFTDDPVSEIMNRPGWGAITAVQNGDVFFVTTNYVNRANHNIVHGLRQIAAAVFPDYF